MNKVIFIGRVTKDIEVKQTQSGIDVARFSLAVQRPFKNKQTGKYDTDFFECVVWRQAASNLAKWCHKGDQLAVTGWMSVNDYVNKETGEKRRSYEVNVEDYNFGAKAGGGNGKAADSVAPAQEYDGYPEDPYDEEMPF